MTRCPVYCWFVVFLLAACWVASTARGELHARVGKQEVIFPDKYRGMQYFPDLPVCVVDTRPWTFYLVAGDSTVLMQGRTFEAANPVAKVLDKGPPDSYDNGYAGISGAYFDKRNREILALFHAEDHQDRPAVGYNPDLRGSYWSVALAVSKDGRQFTKIGQVITASEKKGETGRAHQGVGNVSLCVDHTGEFLLAYYGRLQGVDGRSDGMCVARCRIADRARPGSWYKYYKGQFRENGLGGKDTVIVSTLPQGSSTMAHVQYVESLKKYLMVCDVGTFSDMGNPDRPARQSGIGICYSDDGLQWTTPERLFVGHVIPFNGQEFVSRPSLQLVRSTKDTAFGWLLYAYSPRWGVEPPNVPHHLARRTIAIRKDSGADTPSGKPRSTAARTETSGNARGESSAQRASGKYLLKVTNIRTDQQAEGRRLELLDSMEFTADGGIKGTWEVKQGRVLLKWASGEGAFECRNGILTGRILNRNSGDSFRATATPVEH